MTAQVGDRIELTKMDNDPCPIPVGSRGTITKIHNLQIWVDWDSGRTLMLVPEDEFKIIGHITTMSEEDNHVPEL